MKQLNVKVSSLPALPRSEARRKRHAGGSGGGGSYTGGNMILAIDRISGLQSALDAKLDKVDFDELFEKVVSDNITRIKAKYSLYSVSDVAAFGAGTTDGGTGTGGTSYERLDSWAEYSADKAQYVLSAALGYALYQGLCQLRATVDNLDTGSDLELAQSGSGNAVTAVTLTDSTLTVTKGKTFLTAEDIVGKYLPLTGGKITGILQIANSSGVTKFGIGSSTMFMYDGVALRWMLADGTSLWLENTGSNKTLSLSHRDAAGAFTHESILSIDSLNAAKQVSAAEALYTGGSVWIGPNGARFYYDATLDAVVCNKPIVGINDITAFGQ